MKISFERDNSRVKKTLHLKKNTFIIYSPRAITVETASSVKTNIALRLSKKTNALLTSSFRGDEIIEINSEKNTSLDRNTEHFLYATRKKTKKETAIPKIWEQTWKAYLEKKNCQKGGFLNRNDFAYVGRDTVNEVGKIAPSIIKQATGKIDNIMQSRVNQVIKSGGTEIERVLPKILRGAIEDVYKTPFRLIGKFGKQQFNKIKRRILH